MMKLDFMVNGERLWETLEELARVGATPGGGVTRLALSDEDVQARRILMNWMQETGLSVRVDDAGNLFGRREGQCPELPPVVIGSHLDTVVRGGKFDGAFGVLAALEVVRTLEERGVATRHAVEVVSWSAEEGSRFEPAMLGSGLGTGVFSREFVYSRTDREGRRFGEELERTGFRGGQENRLMCVRAYIEPHIEQGPVLKKEGSEIGVVEGIVSMVWLRAKIAGESGHAGPTPMGVRRDAGVAGARLALAVRDIALALGPEAVGTVGQIEVGPGQVNVIPGEARLSVDFRHPEEAVLSQMAKMLRGWAERICREEGVDIELAEVWRGGGVRFHPEVVETIEEVARGLGYACRRMVSYAGHDAAYVARLGPAGMVFVPCERGKSHTEEEAVTREDVTRGANVVLGAVLKLAG